MALYTRTHGKSGNHRYVCLLCDVALCCDLSLLCNGAVVHFADPNKPDQTPTCLFYSSFMCVMSFLMSNRAEYITLKASTAREPMTLSLFVRFVPSQKSSALCSGYALSLVKLLGPTRSGHGQTSRTDRKTTRGVVAAGATLAHGLWILLDAAPLLPLAIEYSTSCVIARQLSCN